MMKFTLVWLKEHLDSDAPLAAIVDKLTMIGLEVETVADRGKVLAPFSIARVISAEPHPNADKLIVLQIDLGTEQRQICAGIRNHYTPEELVGKQIVVVANLETAKLRGLESQGMLLAASDEGRVVILAPEKSVQPGAKVS